MAVDSSHANPFADPPTTDDEISIVGRSEDRQKDLSRRIDEPDGEDGGGGYAREAFANNINRPNPHKAAPASVARLSPQERIAVEEALVRKIDLRLLPMMVIMYIMNYIDREYISLHLFISLLSFPCFHSLFSC